MPESSVIEAASRWLASRSTRRSFLGKLGRGAVLVAGGSTLATLLVGDEAEARVCGQSGVSPKCPTYDCEGDGVWGHGEILDPNNGKTYRTRLKPVDGGKKLEVRGYIGAPLFGRTQTWMRVE